MKNLDIISGIVVTVVVYLLTPTIPYDMPEGMKLIVYSAQCLISAMAGLYVASFVYEKWVKS